MIGDLGDLRHAKRECFVQREIRRLSLDRGRADEEEHGYRIVSDWRTEGHSRERMGDHSFHTPIMLSDRGQGWSHSRGCRYEGALVPRAAGRSGLTRAVPGTQ